MRTSRTERMVVTALLALGLLGCGGGTTSAGSAGSAGSEEIEFEDEAAARRAPPASEAVAEAESLIAAGEIERAVPLLEQAIARDPNDVRARLDLGLAHE